MGIFAQKPIQPQRSVSTGFVRSPTAKSERYDQTRLIPYLQRTPGNQVVQPLLHDKVEESEARWLNTVPSCIGHDFSQVSVYPTASPNIQAKLTVSTPEDPQEQEADRVADAIVNMERPLLADAQPTHGTPAMAVRSLIQRDVEEEKQNTEEEQNAQELDLSEGEEMDGSVLPKSLASGAEPASTIDARSLGASTGEALPPTAQEFMEPRFGYNFSSIRIHTDPEAARLAGSINAAAFTHGRHIFFGDGRFDQHTTTGRRLLAHELTHVVQQGGGDNSAARANIHRSLLRRPEIHATQEETTHRFWRSVEAHVNLHVPQKVRIYNSGGTPQDFETSGGTGTRTSRLIRSDPYHILGKRVPPTSKVGRWGLQYFAWFHGGIGFHSNICYPTPNRTRTVLTVDGTPHSHGCLRLHPGDSQTVYNALSDGDDVYIYDRASFRPPSWGG